MIGVRGGRYAPPVDLAELPAYVPAAFVAIEDRRFYEHAGFDPMGMARAVDRRPGQGQAPQGASTITQQLARNLFLTTDQTLERKGDELVYAVAAGADLFQEADPRRSTSAASISAPAPMGIEAAVAALFQQAGRAS